MTVTSSMADVLMTHVYSTFAAGHSAELQPISERCMMYGN